MTDPQHRPPGWRGMRPTNGLLYCAMICFTLIVITLIDVLGRR